MLFYTKSYNPTSTPAKILPFSNILKLNSRDSYFKVTFILSMGNEWLKGKIVIKRRFNSRTKRRQIPVKKIREPGAAHSFLFLDSWEILQVAKALLPRARARVCVCVYVCVCVLAWSNISYLFLHYFLWRWLIFLSSDAPVFVPVSPHPENCQSTCILLRPTGYQHYGECDLF